MRGCSLLPSLQIAVGTQNRLNRESDFRWFQYGLNNPLASSEVETMLPNIPDVQSRPRPCSRTGDSRSISCRKTWSFPQWFEQTHGSQSCAYPIRSMAASLSAGE